MASSIQRQLRPIFVVNPNHIWPRELILRAPLGHWLNSGLTCRRRRRWSIGATLMGKERERHAKYVDVFRLKQPGLGIDLIRRSTQARALPPARTRAAK